MAQPVLPLLFGGDINVYSVARAFHEAYGVKSIAYGKFHTFPCAFSSIIDYRTCPDNDAPDTFLRNVQAVAREHAERTIILLGCGDNYVELASKLKAEFPENVRAPYIDGALLDTLINKERFYALCDEYGIDHPATLVVTPDTPDGFALPFPLPCVAKPADSVAYWQHEFEGIKKVYICQTRDELDDALRAVYAGGYPGNMIVQEFIPGDDTYMRVLTNYSDHTGAVRMMCLGHVLLEEHSPYGIGNHAVIITEENEPLCLRIRDFLDALHFVGFSNLDIKYDSRDGKYKVFEINCRQGRSNYYVTGAGHNIARLLVDDLINGAQLPFTLCDTPSLWRMVPRSVALRFIPRAYHPRMKELMRAGRDSHSMDYRADLSPQRRWRLVKNHVGNHVRFRRHNRRPED